MSRPSVCAPWLVRATRYSRPAGLETRARLVDQPQHHGASGADRWVHRDHVKRAVRDRRAPVAEERLGVRHVVERDILHRERDRARIDVHERDACRRCAAGQHDPDRPIAAPEIEHALGPRHVHGVQQEPRAAIDAGAREHPRGRPEPELVVTVEVPHELRAQLRGRQRGEVVLGPRRSQRLPQRPERLPDGFNRRAVTP